MIEPSLISGGFEMGEAAVAMILLGFTVAAFIFVGLYVLRFIIRFLKS